MQNVDRAPYRAYQSAIHAARDEEGKNPSCRRCGAEKETSVHILCECLVLEKIRIQTLGCTRMYPEQIKEARLSGVMALGKRAGLLNSLL